MSLHTRSVLPWLALGVGLAGCAPPAEDTAGTLEPLVKVKVAAAELRDVTLTVEGPAEIHPRAVANIAARLTAPIHAIHVGKGDRVAEGEVLATLDDRDLLAQIADAEAALELARENFVRRDGLFREGAIPERDFLTSKADLERAEAQLALVRAQLAYTELRSPFAAVVTDQYLYPGDMASPSAPLFTVMDASVVTARAQLPEAEATAVRVGQRAVFLAAEPIGGPAEGRVRVVSAAVDPSRRTIEVWCELPNRDGSLHPGAYGTLRIDTATLPGTVVVPLSAVELEEGRGRGTVLVVDVNRVAHRRAVTCGQSFDDRMPITSGLEGGETVVVEGGYGLAEGTAVTFDASETP